MTLPIKHTAPANQHIRKPGRVANHTPRLGRAKRQAVVGGGNDRQLDAWGYCVSVTLDKPFGLSGSNPRALEK